MQLLALSQPSGVKHISTPSTAKEPSSIPGCHYVPTETSLCLCYWTIHTLVPLKTWLWVAIVATRAAIFQAASVPSLRCELKRLLSELQSSIRGATATYDNPPKWHIFIYSLKAIWWWWKTVRERSKNVKPREKVVKRQHLNKYLGSFPTRDAGMFLSEPKLSEPKLTAFSIPPHPHPTYTWPRQSEPEGRRNCPQGAHIPGP